MTQCPALGRRAVAVLGDSGRWLASRLLPIVVLTTGLAILANAAEPPTAVVVFDGSGSMWGKPEGESKAKLIFSREAVKLGLAKLPAEARIGLMSYGHRRAGDCNDVETIVKPEPGSVERITTVLDKLNPKGRGPITNALREATKELGPQSAPASLILIHDDLDNCQLDPCTALGDLRRAHPKVQIHVLSVGMKREDAQKMQCLTKPTGGMHVEVATAQAAASAVEGMLKAAVLDRMREPVAAAPKPQAAVARPPTSATRLNADKPGVQLSASLMEGGALIEAPIRWRVSLAGRPSPPQFEGDAVAPFLDLPPGRYQVEAQFGFVVAKAAIEVTAGAPLSVTLPLGAGAVQLAAASSAAAQKNAVVSFMRTDGPNRTAAILRGISPEVALIPGNYLISVTAGPLRIERPLIITLGQRIALEPQLNFGEVEIQTLASAGGPRLDGAVLTLFEDDPDAPLGRREVVRSAADGATFILPAGTYYAVGRYGNIEARDRFAIRAGEREQRSLIFEAARLVVTAKLPGRLDANEPVTIRLEQLDDSRETSQASRASATFDVGPGRYRLETRIGFGNVRTEREIELKSGARETMTVEAPAGSLRLRLLDPAGHPTPDVAWEVRDTSSRVVWLGNQTEARPLLLAGRYTIRADARNKQVTREVDVKAGEMRTVDLTGP